MSLQVVRAIDNLERYNITRSNVNIYNNVVVGNQLQFPNTTQNMQPFISSWKSSQEWAQLLLHPITYLLDQHPSLSLVIGEHLTANPTFLRLEHVDLLPLVRVAPIKTSVEIGRIIEQEHNLPFDLSDQSTPLWRLTIAPIEEEESKQLFYLLYTFHHVIGDGRSAMVLTEQLVEQLNLQAKSAECTAFTNSSKATKIAITSNKSMPDSIESRINCYPSLRTLIYEIPRGLLLPAFVKKALEIKYWAGDIDASLEVPNETELALLQFTTQETSRVIHAAKRRSTTVQSILYPASVFAAKSVFMSSHSTAIHNNMNRDKDAMVFATPVSLRNLIPNPIAPEDQGNYTSEILDYNVRVQDESNFWEMASAYRKEIVQGTTTTRGIQELLEHFGMLSLLSKKDGGWEAYMSSKIHKDQHGRKATIKLSNLGRGWEQCKDRDDTGFLINNGVFSQSSGVTASALTMNVATANGVMTITTTWQKAAFRGRARGELFMSEFKRILLEAVEDGKQEYLFKDAKRR